MDIVQLYKGRDRPSLPCTYRISIRTPRDLQNKSLFFGRYGLFVHRHQGTSPDSEIQSLYWLTLSPNPDSVNPPQVQATKSIPQNPPCHRKVLTTPTTIKVVTKMDYQSISGYSMNLKRRINHTLTPGTLRDRLNDNLPTPPTSLPIPWRDRKSS